MSTNAERWAQTHLKPVTTLDPNYQQAALAYNQARANSSFLQQFAEYQAGRVAFTHGLYSGAYYGGAVGLVMSIYYRNMMHIPKLALGAGVTYGSLLWISNMYRFDI